MKNYRVKKICSVNGKFCKINDVIESEEHEVRYYVEADFLEEIVITIEPIVEATKQEKK